jgi:clan AA aspartic protease (TIGR02281 family)
MNIFRKTAMLALIAAASAPTAAQDAVSIVIGQDGVVTVNGRPVNQTRQAPSAGPRPMSTERPAPRFQQPQQAYREAPEAMDDASYDGSLEGGAAYAPSVVKIRRSGPYGHFLLKVRVNGVEIKAAVDTGAAQTFLTSADAAATGANRQVVRSTPAYGIAGAVMTKVVSLDEIEIAGVRLRRPTVLTGPGINVTLLGLPELTRIGTITMDGDLMTITPRATR